MSEERSGLTQQPLLRASKKSSRRDLIISVTLLLLLLLVIVGVSLPVLFGCKGCGHGTARTIQNAKQVGYALFNFESDYGCYPNKNTAKKLLKVEGVEFLSSTSGSNYYFSQLIAGGYVDQENPFRVEGVNDYPDDDTSSAEELLKSGEVGFAYVLWDPSMNSGNLHEKAPLIIAYLEKGKKVADSKALGSSRSRIVVLTCDMMVQEFRANRKGIVELDGKDYFDWSQPHWGGQKPKIVWPE